MPTLIVKFPIFRGFLVSQPVGEADGAAFSEAVVSKAVALAAAAVNETVELGEIVVKVADSWRPVITGGGTP
jgi:hypothetical protein